MIALLIATLMTLAFMLGWYVGARAGARAGMDHAVYLVRRMANRSGIMEHDVILQVADCLEDAAAGEATTGEKENDRE